MWNLQIIIGSTRPGRAADRVTPWVVDRASRHGAFAVEVLDLRDWPLPMFAEHIGSIGDPTDPTYSDPMVRAWNRKIAEGDAYLFITPEYNHSVPGVLKNAIDNVFVSFAFRNKPGAFVGYSGGNVGAARAVEHLAHIVIEAEMVPLRNTVLIGQVQSAFDGTEPTNPVSDIALGIALDDLAWWAAALGRARGDGQLAPGGVRLRAALAPKP
jgi:NAD(P)H-dependent FMN reductase